MSTAVYIVGAKRTPVGAFLGALSSVPATELGGIAAQAAIAHAGIDPNLIEELYFGNVVSANLGQAPATQVAIHAGITRRIPATIVNKVCASGAKAMAIAANQIALGQAHILLAGGMENMSRTPHYLPQMRLGLKYAAGEVVDGIMRDGLQDPFDRIFMGEAADRMAAKNGITREAQDAFAIESYKRAEAAQAAGKFAGELVSVTVKDRKGDVVVDNDEEPGNVRYDKIPTLKGAFTKDGTVTAANASKLNDGASAVILASEAAVKQHNLKPLARIVSHADAQLDPVWFTEAPAEAMPLALARAGKTVNDIHLFEINEAFSNVAIYNRDKLGIPADALNIYGGGVSLGHPIGSSGCRIAVTLIHALHNENKSWGMIGICNGGGGAHAMVFEKA